MRSGKKMCGDRNCRRSGELLSLEEFPKHRHRPDGHNNYCRECALRKVHEYRARERAKKKAAEIFRAAIAFHQKPVIMNNVQSAIQSGMQTREQLQRSTHLDYDTLGEILTELIWEVKTVKIERVGNQRRFVVAA